MKNIILFFIFTILSVTAVQAGSGSNYGQYGQYGGGAPSYTISIDKTVGTGSTTKGGVVTYVDNFAISDPRFKPNQKVYFQVKVKNTSNTTVTNVEVTDILPSYVEAAEGPGSYDQNTKIISWKYDQLKAGEEKVEEITAQIYTQNNLPADKGIICMANKATVKVGSAYDEDTAQFCVEKEVVGVTQVPTAGPEYGLIVTALSFAGLGAGVYLKKRI
ncbi:MAG TPA: hypothetical protein PLS49_07020 [Candidatus Woesebacteria bacterium]|nr:hypothetical protein [Candidatus Woesebacteria bacterium]